MLFPSKCAIVTLIRPVESLLQTKGFSLCVLTIYAMDSEEVKTHDEMGDEATAMPETPEMTPETEAAPMEHMPVTEGEEEVSAA